MPFFPFILIIFLECVCFRNSSCLPTEIYLFAIWNRKFICKNCDEFHQKTQIQLKIVSNWAIHIGFSGEFVLHNIGFYSANFLIDLAKWKSQTNRKQKISNWNFSAFNQFRSVELHKKKLNQFNIVNLVFQVSWWLETCLKVYAYLFYCETNQSIKWNRMNISTKLHTENLPWRQAVLWHPHHSIFIWFDIFFVVAWFHFIRWHFNIFYFVHQFHDEINSTMKSIP